MLVLQVSTAWNSPGVLKSEVLMLWRALYSHQLLQLVPKLSQGGLLCTGREGKQPQVLPHDVVAAAALVRGREHAHELYSAWDVRATICSQRNAGLTRTV